MSLFERVGDLEKAVQGNAVAKANINANVNASENGSADAMASRGRVRSGRVRGAQNQQSSGELA